MRRLLRILFNALTVLSLVLAVLVGGLWARSYSGGESIDLRLARKVAVGVVSLDGRMRFICVHYTTIDSAPSNWRRPTAALGRGVRVAYPTSVVDSGRSPGGSYVGLNVTHWFATALLMPLPLVWIWRRRRTPPAGLCPSCGYDLRATPDRCPECGAMPAGVP